MSTGSLSKRFDFFKVPGRSRTEMKNRILLTRNYMEKEALYFNSYFLTYDKIRPGYPTEIYKTIEKYKNFDENSLILEIGAGSGIASKEIYDMWHSKLTLIEPGANFCEILIEQFKNIDDVKIENTTFEKYENKTLFDAIFSATAFHWLDLSVKYKRAFKMLKEDGLLILYWNYYGIENIEMENCIQKIYVKYGMGLNDGKNGYERQMETINDRRREIEESGYFKILDHKIIKRIIEYSASDNTKLLKTFPNHSKLEDNFFIEIENIIRENGNKINGRVLTNIEIGIKTDAAGMALHR